MAWRLVKGQSLNGCATPGCRRKGKNRMMIMGQALPEVCCDACRKEMQVAYDSALGGGAVSA